MVFFSGTKSYNGNHHLLQIAARICLKLLCDKTQEREVRIVSEKADGNFLMMQLIKGCFYFHIVDLAFF